MLYAYECNKSLMEKNLQSTISRCLKSVMKYLHSAKKTGLLGNLSDCNLLMTEKIFRIKKGIQEINMHSGLTGIFWCLILGV